LRLFENDQEIRNRHKYFHQAEKNSRFGYWEFDLTNNIVKTIVTMAYLLDQKVIAEGVETEEQLKIVKESRCTEVQGFYFAKPMPTEDYIKFISTFG